MAAAAVLGSAFQENFSNGGFQSLDELDLHSLTNGKPYQNFGEFRFPSDGVKAPHMYNPSSPSPPTKSPPKPYRSVTDPQTFIDEAKLEAKLSRPRASKRRKERARALSGLPLSHLVEKLVYEEFDAQESRRLLKDAMGRLDSAEKRATQAEADKRALEMAQAVQGFKAMEKVMHKEGDLAKAKEDANVLRYQLQNAQREIERHRDRLKQLEVQRDDAEAAANNARSIAREADSARILAMMQVDTQKRWLEENLRSLTAAAARRKHKHTPPESPSHDKRRDTINDASGTQLNDFRQVLENYKRELTDAFRRESEQRESTRQMELKRMEDDRKHEREMARRREEEIEHEREQMRKRDKERSASLQEEMDKMKDRERKFRRQKNEWQDRESDLKRERDQARDRVRDLERDLADLKKQLDAEKEKVVKAEKDAKEAIANARPPGTLPRVLMPKPPNPNLVPRLPSPPPPQIVPPPGGPAAPIVPPPGMFNQPQPMPGTFPPQQVQPNPYPTRVGRAGSGTPESVSTITVNSAHEILTFDNERANRNQGATLQRQLSAISEHSEVPTASPSGAGGSNASPSPGPGAGGAPPAWFSNPPVDFMSKKQSIDHWRKSTSDAISTEPNSPDAPSESLETPTRRPREGANYLTPTDPRRIDQRSSAGSFNIYVEWPTPTPSTSGDNSGGTEQQERPGFLSPNSAQAPLPRVQEPPQPKHTAPPPVIPPPISYGAPPPGFVAQSMTPGPVIPPNLSYGAPPPGFVAQSMTPIQSNPPPPVIPSSPSTRPTFVHSSPNQPVIPPPPVINRSPSPSPSIYSGWNAPPRPPSVPASQTPAPSTGTSWAQSIYGGGPPPRTGSDPNSRQTPHMTPRSIYQPPPPGGVRPPGVASTGSSTGSGGAGSHTPRSIYGSAGPPPAPPQGILKRSGAYTPTQAPVIPPGARTPSSIYAGLPAQPPGPTHQHSHQDFDDEDNDVFDPVTRRNTEVNSLRRVDTNTPTPALPIPPPGFPRPQV